MQALLHWCPHHAAGHHQPMPPPETSGHSQATLCQSLVGSLFFSPRSWCAQGFVCALWESVSPVLCEFWQLYDEVNVNFFQEGLCHTQIYCTQSPCPCSSPLLTYTSTGDHVLMSVQFKFFFEYIFALLTFLSDQCKEIEENNRMGNTRDLLRKLEVQRNISCKDGLDKGQKWSGPNRSRRY